MGTKCCDGDTARPKAACANRTPEVSFRVRSALHLWSQAAMMGMLGELARSAQALGKLSPESNSGDRCLQQK